MLTKKNILKDKKNSLIKIAATSILSILILFTAINFNSIKSLQSFGQVAGVSEGSTTNLEDDNYSKWIKSYNQDSFSSPEEDLDKDGAEELQKIVDETGLDADDAFEILEAGGL
jgi:hypothetical protein